MFNVIHPKPMIGAEIEADLDTLVSGEKAKEIRDILEQRGVIAIRKMHLSEKDHVTFSESIGDIIRGAGGADETGIGKISMDPKKSETAHYQRGSMHWHIDGASDDVPTRGCVMSAVKIASEGGQTEFANTYAAWDALPEDRKKELENLRVVHTLEASQRRVYPDPSPEMIEGWSKYPPKVHPLVWTHESGRKSLVIGATTDHIEGMDIEEGRALLRELEEWASRPEFVYRHEWTDGDVVIWDNTGTMHRVRPYDISSGRLMHRVTLVGEERIQ